MGWELSAHGPGRALPCQRHDLLPASGVASAQAQIGSIAAANRAAHRPKVRRHPPADGAIWPVPGGQAGPRRAEAGKKLGVPSIRADWRRPAPKAGRICPANLARELLVIALHIHQSRRAELLEVRLAAIPPRIPRARASAPSPASATGPPSARPPHPSKRAEQDGCQNCENSDYHKQLNQGEPAAQ